MTSMETAQPTDPLSKLYELAKTRDKKLQADFAESVPELPTIGHAVFWIADTKTQEELLRVTYIEPWQDDTVSEPNDGYIFAYKDSRFGDLVVLELKSDGFKEGIRYGNLRHRNGYEHTLTNESTLRRNARAMLSLIEDSPMAESA